MTKASKIVSAVIILGLIVAGVVAWTITRTMNSSSSNNASGQTHNQDSDQGIDPGADQAASTEVTITYNGNSFKMSASSIQAGGTVTLINSSNKPLDFSSDPHPTHTDNPELNIGDVAAGKQKSFVLTTTGKWGFHNHLNSSQHGSIEVR